MTQYLIMGVIVLWAVLYSAWVLMPSGARRTVATRFAGWARHFGLGESKARGLQEGLAQSGGCNACSSCPGCHRGAEPSGRFIPIASGPRPH